MARLRLIFLNSLLAIGLGSIFLLPKTPPIQESSIRMELPYYLGDWTGGPDKETSSKVKDILQAKAYASRDYVNEMTGQKVTVMIVLSSDNINQSIHRPERCLPAQGQVLLETSEREINLPETKKPLLVKRLLTELRTETEEGQKQEHQMLTYYWFVGKSQVTSSHYERTWIDISDRLFRGYAQRWAYVTVQSAVAAESEVPIEEGLKAFTEKLYPKIALQ